MGDHRASIKIEMEFHGVKDKCDMWVNYSPEGCCGMDYRVIEFFASVYEKGMDKYNEMMDKWTEEQSREENEKAERRELARLKEKYKETQQ